MKDKDTVKKLQSIHKLISKLKKQTQEEFDLLHELELEVVLWIESLLPKRKRK